MITALYAARNICGANYDLWAVNTEPDYHEEKQDERKPESAPSNAAIGLRRWSKEKQASF